MAEGMPKPRTVNIAIPVTTVQEIERRMAALRELQGHISQAQRGLNAGLELAEREYQQLEVLLASLLEGGQ